MKKSVSLLLCFVLLCSGLLLFTGCHGRADRAAFTVPEEFDTNKNYEITFWAKNDTNLTQKRIYEKAIADFQALYPNVSVKMRSYNDYSKIYNDVITNIATNTTPNVCISYPDHIATYLTGDNVVAPLDPLFADPHYGFGGDKLRYDGPDADEMIGKYLNECIVNGAHWAIPFMRSTEALYVNESMLHKLGYTLPDEITWDFVWEASEAAAKRDENGVCILNGQKTMLPFIYKSTDNMMIQMLKQKGAPYSDENGAMLMFNDEAKALLLDIAEHTQKRAFSTFKVSSYPGNYLNAGQCLFAVDSTAGATWMGKAAPHADISEEQFVDYEIAVRPIPQFDPAHPQMISQGPSVCVFNKKDPQEVLAAWLFAQYLLTNEVQIAYAQTEGYVPVTEKAQKSAEYLDYLSRAGEDDELYYDVKIAASRLLLENVENTFVTPVFNGSASLRKAAGETIEGVVSAVRLGKTPDAAYVDGIFKEVRAQYKLDQIAQNSAADSGAVKDLGPLPKPAVLLLAGLAAVWVLLGVSAGATLLRGKRKRKT